jgi:hypothetical protein
MRGLLVEPTVVVFKVITCTREQSSGETLQSDVSGNAATTQRCHAYTLEHLKSQPPSTRLLSSLASAHDLIARVFAAEQRTCTRLSQALCTIHCWLAHAI